MSVEMPRGGWQRNKLCYNVSNKIIMEPFVRSYRRWNGVKSPASGSLWCLQERISQIHWEGSCTLPTPGSNGYCILSARLWRLCGFLFASFISLQQPLLALLCLNLKGTEAAHYNPLSFCRFIQIPYIPLKARTTEMWSLFSVWLYGKHTCEKWERSTAHA